MVDMVNLVVHLRPLTIDLKYLFKNTFHFNCFNCVGVLLSIPLYQNYLKFCLELVDGSEWMTNTKQKYRIDDKLSCEQEVDIEYYDKTIRTMHTCFLPLI